MRVLCTLQHASEEIDGVKFERVDGGMLSSEVTDEIGHRWITIPGFSLYSETAKPAAEPADEPDRKRPARAAKKDVDAE